MRPQANKTDLSTRDSSNDNSVNTFVTGQTSVEMISKDPNSTIKEQEYEEDLMESENLMEPSVPISAADFTYIKVIGRGSFGKVCLVTKESNQKPYALKIMRKDVLVQFNMLNKIQSERKILECADSPYLVKLHYAF